MTVFKFTGQWIIAKNIDTIMGLQATATKRKLELDDVSKSCASDVEDRCQDEQQNQQEELNVDEVDGSVSPPKITKYELPAGEEDDEVENDFKSSSNNNNNISDKEQKRATTEILLEEDINVQELTNECKSTYISHSLAQPMIVEDSIAKLEAVAIPGEIIAPWKEPQIAMDSISRLQAVAVPDEGSDGTRSALATTLLSDDLCDDDDDDFDDDFDEDDHLPPRYNHCPPVPAPRASPYGNQAASGSSYSNKLQSSPPHSYYMDYPPQHNNRVYNWQQSYGYEQQPQQQQAPQPQQTIRCAENGKSYLELGSSNASSTTASASSYQSMNGHQNMHQMHRPAPSVTPHHYHPHHHHHHHHPSYNHPHHHPSAAMKRCCDGRPSTWCQSNNNKQCYKDRRMSMLNLSMFKLSRFRQVSEQSLYRSVLICNTLKQIEREIEMENKEAAAAARQHQQQMHLHAMQMHHMQQQQQQQQQQQHQQQQGSSGEQVYGSSSNSSNSQGSLYQRQTTTSPVFSQQQQQLHHNQLLHHHHHHQQQQQQQQSQQMHFQSNTDGVTYSSQGSNSSGSLDHLQVASNSNSSSSSNQGNSNGITGFTFGASRTAPSQQQLPSSQPQAAPLMSFNDSLPPYDHPHPLRDTSSGRATPFPVSSNANGPQSDADSGFGDEDCTRPINWGSVLSLSSQSALDPLAGSDLFATGATGSPLTPITPTMILPTAQASTMAGLPPTNIENGTSTSSAHLKVLSSVKEASRGSGATAGSDGEGDSGISMMDEEEEEEESAQLLSIGSSRSITTVTNSILRTSSTTLTTTTTTTTTGSGSELLPSWLDMESELTELLPSWKLTPLSAEDIFKSVPHQSQQPMEPSRIVHESSEMETGFTHIMVVS